MFGLLVPVGSSWAHRDAPDHSDLSHQVHEGVFDPDQDVGGHPVAAALLDVGSGGVGIVSSRRGRSGRHGAVAHGAGARAGLQGAIENTERLWLGSAGPEHR